MKAIINLIFIFLPIYFFSQNLDVKIIETAVISKNNIKIKILVNNQSNSTFEYNKIIEIKYFKNIVKDDVVNVLSFYKEGKWVNVPTMRYGKTRTKRDNKIKIRPNSKKVFTINLKRDLSIERYRGLYLTLHLVDLQIVKYEVLLYFKDVGNNSYEKYELSSMFDMTGR